MALHIPDIRESYLMALHIPDIRAIRLFVPFVIPSTDFITNFTNGRMTRILTGYFLASPKRFYDLIENCLHRYVYLYGFMRHIFWMMVYMINHN
jgi:hypothetical protein